MRCDGCDGCDEPTSRIAFTPFMNSIYVYMPASGQPPKAAVLYREGDPADKMFFVIKGRVRLFKRTSSLDIEVKRFVGPGEWFGETSLNFEGEVRG